MSKAVLHIRFGEPDRPFYQAHIDEQKLLVFRKSIWLEAENITLIEEIYARSMRQVVGGDELTDAVGDLFYLAEQCHICKRFRFSADLYT